MVANIKKYLIIGSITVFLSVLGLLGYYYNQSQKYKQETKEKSIIINSNEKIFKNSLGQYASEVDVWTVKYKDLEKSANQSDVEKSDIQKKYTEAYRLIEEYKRKNKDLISYYSALLQSKDTIYQPMPSDCELKPISTKYINIGFIYNDSSVGVVYDYHTGVSTLVTLYPKIKDNGKKHWPNWGWIWGWDKKSITTVEDPKARLNNQVSIEFKR